MSTPPDRVAHHIRVDHRHPRDGGGIYVEGVRVPFFVSPGSEVVDFGEGALWGVSLTIYADNVEVVGLAGEASNWRSATAHAQDMEWARREARRIVHEGMADILEWCWEGMNQRALEDFPARYVMGLDEETRKALTSETTHSQE